MRDELTQKELDEIFYGPSPEVRARFYDHDALDVAASKEAGERRYRKRVYVELKCEREKAFIVRPKQDNDEREFRREWQAYQQEKENERHRPVSDPCDKTVRIGEALAKAQTG